jgi:hypothetical protein
VFVTGSTFHATQAPAPVSITISGRGKAVYKAVSVAEILKEKYQKGEPLTQSCVIYYYNVTDIYKPVLEGLDTYVAPPMRSDKL